MDAEETGIIAGPPKRESFLAGRRLVKT